MVQRILPVEMISSLQGVAGFDEQQFLAIHSRQEQVTSVRFNPIKLLAADQQDFVERVVAGSALSIFKPVPWSVYGYYLKERPSFILDPLWHTGSYYVQEASSMFVEQALRQHADTFAPLRVLDACAAPGGKSTHLQSLLSKNSLLVSNEVIKTRVNILSENMTRWGASNVLVTSNDPKDFSPLGGFFDVLMVDAPCSGSGLWRREPEAIDEWSPANVQLCAERQQRILADLWPSLKEDGLLIYSTCSYSKKEDEEILDWLCGAFEVESLPVALQEEWNIVPVHSEKHQAWGYRFYPYNVEGEGFFLACLRKKNGLSLSLVKPKKALELLPDKESGLLDKWIGQPEAFAFVRQQENIRAIPRHLLEDYHFLSQQLRIRKAGVAIGQVMKNDLVPEAELALSSLLSAEVPFVELSREQALRYVRKEDLQMDTGLKGWAVVGYEGSALGWVKVLSNRINNYFPKEWRVLKRDDK